LQNGLIEARAVEQIAIFEAAQLFAMSEGIIPAPESAHAIRVAIDEALKCKENGEEKAILFGLSGHGHFDMSAYDEYKKGNLTNVKHPQSEIDKALATLPKNQINNE
jgi:tryptophan synthase beta chain